MSTEPARRPNPADPCERTDPHLPHRNWQSENCGVCPGRKQPTNPPKENR
ncbi:hypothetical protein LUW77_03275 [Streptomyces radiopugnans]|nr:hypothetical protein LUW77_03275 [Streptomyces radiopugnans]